MIFAYVVVKCYISYVDDYAETVVISTFDECDILDKATRLFFLITRAVRWHELSSGSRSQILFNFFFVSRLVKR